MKNSKTTIRELTAKYKSILKKCAILNAVCIMAMAGVANATVTPETIDYDYPTGSKTEKVYTVTGTEGSFPSVTMSDDPIVNLGDGTTSATVTDAGTVTLTNFSQLNVAAGSSLSVGGKLINEARTYVVGPVDLDYDGPRYVQTYTKESTPVKDENAYAINNFGTITATEIRNKETIINYENAVVNGDIVNILTVNEDGNPVTISTFENKGYIYGNVSNAGSFVNAGIITGNVSNTGTMSSSLGNITGTIDNGHGVLSTWGTLDRDLNGTLEFKYDTTLESGAAHTLSGSVTNAGTFTVGGDLTVSNAYSISENNGTLNILGTGSVTSNITNTGNINNDGSIIGNVTNQQNGILNTELSTVSGKIYNYGKLNTWGSLNQTDFNNRLADSTDKTLNLIKTSTLTSDLDVYAVNLSSSLNTNGHELKSTGFNVFNGGTLNIDSAGNFNGVIANAGNVNNAGEMIGTITNNNILANTGSITNSSAVDTTITNNGTIENTGTISNSALTNNGILYNRTTTATGIADTEIDNKGILMNVADAKIINTVTNDSTDNPSVSNTHTIINNGYIQAKKFTNDGIIHNLGVMGDNIAKDETIATNYSTFQNNGTVYNNRIIKADSITNNGTIQNYDIVVARVLENNGAFRNEASIGLINPVTVNNHLSLYNGGTIYGSVTNYAGAELTSPIYTISGKIYNYGTFNTWGNLESVNDIDLGGTTNLIYDSSLKKNISTNVLNVKNGSVLDLETNKLTTNSLNVEDNSSVALRVKSKDTYGSVAASSYTVGTGTKLSFVLDKGILTEGNTITLPVFTDASGNVANLDFGTILNNRYQITKEANGAYTISYEPSTSGDVLNYGGDQNVINASVAWLDEDDMPEGTEAAKIQDTLHTLAQTDMYGFVKAVRSLMPETAPVGYTLSNLINNKVAEAVEGRFLSRRVVIKKEQPRRGRNGGDVVTERTTGSVWAKGLYNKTKLDTKLGFDAKTDGVAFGIDGKANEHLTIGVGYAYTGSDVDSKSRKTDVSTHTGILYSEYANGQCFMNAVVNYNRSEYEEKKNVAGYNVKADYTSDAAFARVMGGFHIPVKYVIFTPEGGLRYLWIKMNGYTDTAGQSIRDESTSSLTGVVGLRVGAKTKLIGLDQVLFWPEVAVRATYDIVDADNNIAVNLPNGSTYTIRGETLERFGVETAAKLGMLSGNVEVSLEYLGKYRKDYYDHTGLVSLKYRF